MSDVMRKALEYLDRKKGSFFFPLITFYFLYIILNSNSTFSSPESMNAYFGGESLAGSWKWAGSWSWDVSPFKYRILFHLAVDSAASAMTVLGFASLKTYWLALIVISTLSFVFAVYSLYLLLKTLGFNTNYSYIGIIFWMALPPIHFAYIIPTQTKEDFLAYAIFFLALRAILEGQSRSLILLALIGAFTRETLLLIPGLYLISPASRSQKVYCFATACITYGMIRLYMGSGSYQFPDNWSSSYLLPISLFYVLGFAWVFVFESLWRKNPLLSLAEGFKNLFSRSPLEASKNSLFQMWLPWVLLTLLPTYCLLGRIQEIRIGALLAPWAIVRMLEILRRTQISFVLKKQMIGSMGLACILILAIETIPGLSIREYLNPHIAEFSQSVWWMEFYIQIVLCSTMFPLLASLRKYQTAK
jgi:hypothetical protein